MKPNGPGISLTSYDEIFSTEESRSGKQPEQVRSIPISELFPFKDHPFSVVDDKRMEEMVESVKEFGVMVPVIARPWTAADTRLCPGIAASVPVS